MQCPLAVLIALSFAVTGCGAVKPSSYFFADNGESPTATYDTSGIMMALPGQAPSSDERYTLYASAGANTTTLEWCESNTIVECGTNAPGYVRAKIVRQQNDRVIFRAEGFVTIRRGLTLAVSAYDAAGQRMTRLVRFTPVGESDTISERPPQLGDAPKMYFKLATMKKTLVEWAAAAPDLIKAEKYADINGYEAWYLRISASVSDGKPRPKVLITAATHGDEYISTATILGFTHRFASALRSDARITELAQTRDIYIVPVVCPDGYTLNSRSVEGGQDPNRSFPAPTNSPRAATKCAKALMELFHKVQFNAVIDYHAHGRMMMYPWTYTAQPISEGSFDLKYRQLAQKMATKAGYSFGQPSRLLGYHSEGSSSDYFHWQGNAKGYNTCAMAVEVGTQKAPDPRYIAPEVDRNYEALVNFIKEAPVLFNASSYTSALGDDDPQPDYDNELVRAFRERGEE